MGVNSTGDNLSSDQDQHQAVYPWYSMCCISSQAFCLRYCTFCSLYVTQ